MRIALAEERGFSPVTKPCSFNDLTLLVVIQLCLLHGPTLLDREANADLSLEALLACLLRPFSRVA